MGQLCKIKFLTFKMKVQGEDASIPAPALQTLIGTGAHDRQGKGNINAGDGGIAFIVASAESIPGRPELVRFCSQKHMKVFTFMPQDKMVPSTIDEVTNLIFLVCAVAIPRSISTGCWLLHSSGSFFAFSL